MQAILLTLSTIFALIAPTTYIFSIVKGHAKPHRMTRFLFAFVLTLNFFGILASHGNLGAIIFAGVSFLQSIIIFFLSLWRGMGGASKLDIACLLIAIGGIIGWKLTGSPILAVWFSILADFAAAIPTFIKTWENPNTESVWFYLLSAVAAFLSLVAYKINSASIFQIYIIIGCLFIVFLIYRKKINLV